MKIHLSKFFRCFFILVFILTAFNFSYSTIVLANQENFSDTKPIDYDLEKEGVLRVGMEANYAPFNWSQANPSEGAYEISNSPGEFANGYDVQIAKKLAESLDLQLEIVKLEWDGLPPALASGKIDAIIAGMSATEERKKQIDFTDNYYESQMVLVIRKDSSFSKANSLEDFSGAKVTAQLNTFHYDLINQIPSVKKQTALDSFPTLISSVLAGKVDAYLSEEPGAMAAVAANSDLTYLNFSEGNGFDLSEYDTGIAIGLRKGSPLLPALNQALKTLDVSQRNEWMQEMVDLNQQQDQLTFLQEMGQLWNDYGAQFIRGALNTLFIALIATLVGSIIGLAVATFRSMRDQFHKGTGAYYLFKLVDILLVSYIEIFRGTPMMVQAMLIFYGLKLFLNIDLSAMTAALFIVSINTGAYLSEVMRGGIQGVDKGQYEGAKAIGMSHWQTMRHVVLPQAVLSILPTLGNEFVINIKDTSVLNVIAVTELFFISKSVAGSTYLTFQTFLITSLIYFVLTFSTTRLLNGIEKRMSGSDSYTVKQSSSTSAVKGVKTHD